VSLLRALARRHASLAALLLVLAMVARAAVPAGYMTEVRGFSLALVPCNGIVDPHPAMAAMPGMDMPDHSAGGGHDQHHADQPCAFAGLTAPLASDPANADLPIHAARSDAFVARATPALKLREPIPRPPSRGPPPLA